MLARQRGATFLGMLTIAAILGFGLYAGMRLIPVYYEYMRVAKALEKVSNEFKGQPTSPDAIRLSLTRSWTVEDIESIDPRDPKAIVIKKENDGFTVQALYRAEAPFLGNIHFVVDFDKTVTVRSGS
jgi:hypothetical protein